MPVPLWCKELLGAWLLHAGVGEGKVFRRLLKGGTRQDVAVTANVVWYAVKRCAALARLSHLAPHDLRRYARGSVMVLEQIQFLLGYASVKTTEIYRMQANLRETINDRLGIALSIDVA